MTDQEYFSRGECSNSDLGKIKELLGRPNNIDPTIAFYRGSLVDAMITEPHRVDFLNKRFEGNIFPDVFDKAVQMRNAFMADDFCTAILKTKPEFQKVFIRNMDIEYKGVKFNLGCRCKWDFFGPISGDIKTTSATNLQQFETACTYFDYWRSRAWYMDISGTDRDVLIGISVKNLKIFKIVINRGDEKYNLGKQQYSELALKYWAIYGSNN